MFSCLISGADAEQARTNSARVVPCETCKRPWEVAFHVENRLILSAVCLGLAMSLEICCYGTPQSTDTSQPAANVRLTERERAWINAYPQVRWGVDPDWAPFSSFDHDQKLVGIDADITQLVAQRVGLKLSLVRAT